MTNKCNASDWSPSPEDLNEVWAHETLADLSKEDAASILKVNPTTYTEAIAYAKGSCFLFHLENLLDFLLSNESEDNFAAAYAYMELVSSCDSNTLISSGLHKKLKLGAKRISERQLFYGADIDIYGDFSKMYAQFSGE